VAPIIFDLDLQSKKMTLSSAEGAETRVQPEVELHV